MDVIVSTSEKLDVGAGTIVSDQTPLAGTRVVPSVTATVDTVRVELASAEPWRETFFSPVGVPFGGR